MKNIRRFLGFIAIVAIIGFTFTACEDDITALPDITTTELPDGVTGTAYSQTLEVAGDALVVWSITEGNLPDGLSLNPSTGEISGTPTATGTFSFTVKAENIAGSDTQEFSITITAAPIAPNITTTELLGGITGTAYSQTLEAAGNTPIVWSITEGNLPDGLSLNPSTGEISGTPTATGAFSFTVKAENIAGSDTQEFSITITAVPTITTASLPGGITGTAYSQTLEATGEKPIAWSIDSGDLPEGLSLDTSTGEISGTPTATGTLSFTVSATNDVGSDTQELSITILSPGVAVGKPEVSGTPTHNSITVNAIDDLDNEQTVEYNISTESAGTDFMLETWQSDTSFIGLDEGTTYFVYARSAENDDFSAGQASVSDAITTLTIINIPAIQGVTVPVVGASPVTVITETDQYTGTVTWEPNHTSFAALTPYTATITLTAKDGYTLGGVAEDFFTVEDAASVSNDADSGIITAEFPATGTAIITTLAIPGVTAPAIGASPVAAITETAQYTGTVSWSPDHTTFAAGTQYTATITLTEKHGYTLGGVAENSFTVAGATLATHAANSGVITAVFPATAATITTRAIPGVTAPVTGATRVTAITETTQYTGTVSWSPNDTTFAGATQYTATITLTAKAGFTLQGVAANWFTVAGATTVTHAANSGVITVVFPATAAATITTRAIPGVTAPVTGAARVTAITETTEYTGTVSWNPNHTTFAGGTQYTATITLTAKAGFTLQGVTANSFTVAGATTVTHAANSGVITAVFPATAATVTTRAIPGVTAPVTGAARVTSITETTEYTGTVTWTLTSGGAAFTGNFAAVTQYTATITLTPKTGFTLQGVTANWFTVAGATTVTHSANSGVITARFPATERIPGAAVNANISMVSRTRNSITINPVAIVGSNPGSQTVEYNINTSDTVPTGSWTSGTTLHAPNPDTTYYIFARSRQVGNYSAGTASAASFRTTPEYTVELNGKTIYVYRDEIYNRMNAAPAGQAVTVTGTALAEDVRHLNLPLTNTSITGTGHHLIWQASYTGNAGLNSSLISVSFNGIFEVRSGGTITQGDSGSAISLNSSDTAIIINGGSVIGTHTAGGYSTGINITAAGASVTVNSGTVRSAGGSAILYMGNNNVTVTINGGTVETNTPTSSRGAIHIAGGRILINGGTVRSNNPNSFGLYPIGNNPVVFINSGATVGRIYTDALGSTGLMIQRTAATPTTFNSGSNTNLTVTGSGGSATWGRSGSDHGINYSRGGNTGFFRVPNVTVN